MKEINSNDFAMFIRNELPREKMLEVEQALIKSGSSNAILSSIIEEYAEIEKVDDLIGVDEESDLNIFAESEKRFEESCKNFHQLASVVVNDNNYSTSNFSKMNKINITTEDLAKVTERYNAISSLHDENVSLKENLVKYYLSAHAEATDEDAQQIVDKILNGCEELTQKYNEALAGEFKIEDEIAKLTEGKSTAESFSILVNALALVQTLNLKTFSSQVKMQEELEKAINDLNTATPNPTDADCDALKKLLVEAIENTTLLVNGVEGARQLFDAANTDKATAINFASENYDDARVKAETALAMWLEYQEGNLESLETGLAPEAIAIGAATAVEEAKVMDDVAKGLKTADVAIKCLKILGGIALTCILGYVGALVAAIVGGAASFAIMSLIGTSTIACIATTILIIPLIWGIASLELKAGETILNKAGDVYDFVVDKLRKHVFPKIAETANKFIDWIKTKFQTARTSTTEAPSVSLG
jgi:hypothetical protein